MMERKMAGERKEKKNPLVSVHNLEKKKVERKGDDNFKLKKEKRERKKEETKEGKEKASVGVSVCTTTRDFNKHTSPFKYNLQTILRGGKKQLSIF